MGLWVVVELWARASQAQSLAALCLPYSLLLLFHRSLPGEGLGPTGPLVPFVCT